jgi:hypothetical protein
MGFGESDAGVGEVSLAGFNGADHGLTAGSSSGKTQLKFWLGTSKKKSGTNNCRESHLYSTLPCI